ncbi:putative glycoside hydrolase [Paucibacter soli]|uniref:putative glycoside hydrolase n=1 Tax=Paucibacter soli TaxID=3133433 RepID=UPI003094BE34
MAVRSVALLSLALLWAGVAGALELQVVDAATGQPIAAATLVAGGMQTLSDVSGRAELVEPGARAGKVSARAPGYQRRTLTPAGNGALRIALQPIQPKALYLSAYGIGNAQLRGDALQLIAHTELNALVIDVKGDRGIVPYRSAAVAAAGLAQPIVTVADMPALMAELKGRGLYLIARIVVFKDEPLAQARPDWAVRDARGELWKDREELAWIDPFQREAWERSLALAEEAAALGFDELQFDYLRFPDQAGLSFSQPNTEAGRVAAIVGFLDAARQRVARHNVFIAADIFGYVLWNSDDTQIGQQLERLAGHVDLLSPMLYPSGFSFGIPGHREPMKAPYELVEHSLQRASARTGRGLPLYRPWLQAFADYAFDHRAFGAAEIRAQIDAAEAQGTQGWMLWNPRNRYAADGLKAKTP